MLNIKGTFWTEIGALTAKASKWKGCCVCMNMNIQVLQQLYVVDTQLRPNSKLDKRKSYSFATTDVSHNHWI